ncbi:MAG: hypothetical protein ACYC64_13695 [Armatimonadota bacterium]
MKHFLMALLCLMIIPAPAWSQDDMQADGTITISKEEFESLKARVEALEQLLRQNNTVIDQATDTQQATSTAGKALALPDISFIGQGKFHTSSDNRDEDRNGLRLSEGELGIQGWVYPNVKADAFISMSPQEDKAAQLEEAYLSYLGVRKGLNFYAGQKYVPFGRTNQLHSHSWPWVNRPVAFRNLVAEENLTGEGFQLSYVLPTSGNLFAQLDLGAWAGGGGGESTELPDIVVGPGAGFNGLFNTGRLWTGCSLTPDDELELGGSIAEGESEDLLIPFTQRTRLTGADISYRHFGDNDSRFLLRGEYFWRKELSDINPGTARGYYGYTDYRWDKRNSLGLLYSWSQFPQATDLHESQASLIYTHQFSEQYYIRLQDNYGSRPGFDRYNELWLEWVWGVGPHSHTLE